MIANLMLPELVSQMYLVGRACSETMGRLLYSVVKCESRGSYYCVYRSRDLVKRKYRYCR